MTFVSGSHFYIDSDSDCNSDYGSEFSSGYDEYDDGGNGDYSDWGTHLMDNQNLRNTLKRWNQKGEVLQTFSNYSNGVEQLIELK